MGYLRTVALVWMAMSAVAACGETSSGGSPTGAGGEPGGDSGSAGIQEFVKAYCDGARTCCGKAGFPLDPLADCETRLSSQTDTFAFVQKGTVTVDSAALDACVKAFHSAVLTCDGSTAVDPVCQTIFNGTIPPEASCEGVEECAGRPVVCLKILPPGITTTPATGVCKAAPRAKEGDPCFSTCAPGRSCSSTYSTSNPNPPLALCYEADGLFCSRVGTDARCAPLSKVGAACTTYDSCGSNLFCNSAFVCIERKPIGAACTESGECGNALTCVNGVCATPPLENQKTCRGDFN